MRLTVKYITAFAVAGAMVTLTMLLLTRAKVKESGCADLLSAMAPEAPVSPRTTR